MSRLTCSAEKINKRLWQHFRSLDTFRRFIFRKTAAPISLSGLMGQLLTSSCLFYSQFIVISWYETAAMRTVIHSFQFSACHSLPNTPKTKTDKQIYFHSLQIVHYLQNFLIVNWIKYDYRSLKILLLEIGDTEEQKFSKYHKFPVILKRLLSTASE